jgi:D-3-phosphoglycerate dehydrogenase
MPKGGTLVNTARKEVIDEESLKRILEERPDFKYVSDIAPECHADLLKYEHRYYSTPKKQGAETSEANINAGLAAANQIVGYLEKKITTFQVNKF